MRRLLSLDYLLERPRTTWLVTDAGKVDALTAAGSPGTCYRADSTRARSACSTGTFPHKMPVGLNGWRATFVFALAEDETPSAVRTWGSQHGAPWAGLAAAGRPVEVVVVGRDPERLAAAEPVLDKWATTPPESVTDVPPGGRGGDGRDQDGDRDERLGRPGGVGRPEPRVAADPRPQRRLRRKPPIHGRDHGGPDVALDEGAVRLPPVVNAVKAAQVTPEVPHQGSK